MRPASLAFAGLCASLVGIGLARFAYTPLIPALIAAGWFAPGEAAYLGAANLAGYLAGALLAGRLARAVATATVLRLSMTAIGLSFIACSWALPFLWFFAWRFVSGFAGGAIMALSAPAILARTDPARRGLIGGVVFTGVGLGAVASGTLVPLLLMRSLGATWAGIGVLCLALTALAWRRWPPPPPARPAVAVWKWSGDTLLFILQYGLCAVGLVPHMVFLSDFVARGLGLGVAAGARAWVAYGLGAAVGPLAAGWIADRVGFARAMRWALPVQAAAVGLPLVSDAVPAVLVSAVVAGAFTPGIVSFALGRAQDFSAGDPDRHRAIWSAATVSFAVFQAIAAYGLAFLFARTGGGYGALFAAGVVALMVAILLDAACDWARIAGRGRMRG